MRKIVAQICIVIVALAIGFILGGSFLAEKGINHEDKSQLDQSKAFNSQLNNYLNNSDSQLINLAKKSINLTGKHVLILSYPDSDQDLIKTEVNQLISFGAAVEDLKLTNLAVNPNNIVKVSSIVNNDIPAGSTIDSQLTEASSRLGGLIHDILINPTVAPQPANPNAKPDPNVAPPPLIINGQIHQPAEVGVPMNPNAKKPNPTDIVKPAPNINDGQLFQMLNQDKKNALDTLFKEGLVTSTYKSDQFTTATTAIIFPPAQSTTSFTNQLDVINMTKGIYSPGWATILVSPSAQANDSQSAIKLLDNQSEYKNISPNIYTIDNINQTTGQISSLIITLNKPELKHYGIGSNNQAAYAVI